MPRSKEENARIRAEAQERIIDTAISVFARKGFSGTSINDIAEAANISGGLMYRYFESKQDLFDKIIDFAVAGLQGLTQLIESSITPRETLELICGEILASLDDEMYLNINSMIVQGLVSQDSSAFEKILLTDVKMIEAITGLIIKGQKMGVFLQGDPVAKTNLFMSAIQGIIILKIAFRDRMVLPTVPDMMAHLLAEC